MGTNASIFLAPHEFTSVPFPVKALKIIIHDIQSEGDSATFIAAQTKAYDVESDDEVRFNVASILQSIPIMVL